MSPAQFDAIVERVSALARQRPRAYRRRLIGLALLGYAYVLAVLLGIILLGAIPPLLEGRIGAATVKIELVLLGVVVVIVRAMWVAVRPEQGLVLTRAQVPALFDTVERVRERMAAPRLYRILLTEDLNAAVQQVPRFGGLGQRNYLLLGLPLLQALSPAQFDAVLAHEFGHLSHRHGRFGAWIYRIRTGWNRLVETMDADESWLRFLFGPFFRWYAPLFSAYSFVEARAQEHEADRSAAEAFGAHHLASALVSIRLAAEFLAEKYWPSLLEQIERVPEPPRHPFSTMPTQLTAQLTSPAAGTRLANALAEQTTSADTHPCLRERLEALGEAGIAPEVPGDTAVALLGDQGDALARHFDEQWSGVVEADWKERHAAIAGERARLDALQAMPAEARSAEEWWELCRLTHTLEDEEAALPLCRETATRFPDHRQARYALGALLLARDDDSGLVHLEAAMHDDPVATVEGWELAYDHLRRRGRQGDAEALFARAEAAGTLLHAADQERTRIDRRTRYVPHDVPPEVVARLRAAVAAEPEVKRAWLVRKELTLLPERPLYVLAVLRRPRWYRFERGRENSALVDRLLAAVADLPLPLQCFVASSRGEFRRIARVAGAQIYPPLPGQAPSAEGAAA